MTSQSDTLAKRKGMYTLMLVGENAQLTVFAPRDGARRVTSAADLTITFTPAEFDRFAADVAFFRAGMGR